MFRRLVSLAFVLCLWPVAGSTPRAAHALPTDVPRQPVPSRDIQRAPAQTRTPAAPARHNLLLDEHRGGHTLARHVGRSESELRERLRRERSISAASTYPDRETAERVVAATLQRERFRIQDWIRAGTRHPNLALDYHSDRPIGSSLGRGQPSPQPCYDAVVVLKWDAGRHDFYVLTSYPEVRR